MANITLSGTLLDPNSGFAARDKIRFTHKTTTGSTLKGSVSTLVIGADGAYSIDLQYGLVLVERRDSTKSQYINLGVVTVNADNPATTLPELLSATVPVSSEELIEFQSILADCVAAQEAAEAAAAESKPFKSVADMKASTVIKENDFIKTVDYYSTQSGGGAEYLIKTQDQANIDGDIIDGYGNHALLNGNVAILQNINNLINVRQWGIISDGITSITSSLHAIGAYIRADNDSKIIDFGHGDFLVTPELDPFQSPNTNENVIWSIPVSTTLIGGGHGVCKLNIEFPNKTASVASNSRFFIMHEGKFEISGIHFQGDQPRESFAFFPLNNGNSCIGAAFRNATYIDGENIHDCRFSDIPGFYSGTSVLDTAFFTSNIVEYCGNGYNVSGRNIIVTDNYFEWSEGVESAGSDSNYVQDKIGGKISVNDNLFYNCSIAASLGGNISTSPTARSEGYSFIGNVVVTEDDFADANHAVVIANNADSVVINSNITGNFTSALISITSGGTPLSLTGDVKISGYGKSLNSSARLISCGGSDNTIIDINNFHGKTPNNSGHALLIGGQGTVNVKNCSFGARFVLSYGTGNNMKVNYCPFSNDRVSDRPGSFLGGKAAVVQGTLNALVSRSSFLSLSEAQAAQIMNINIADSNQFNENEILFQMFADGTIKWGDGIASNPDVVLSRTEAAILNCNAKLTADLGIGVGNSENATSLGAVIKNMEIFDSLGVSLGFVPIYDSIT